MTLTIRRTQPKMAAAFWREPLKRIIDKGYSLCVLGPARLSAKILRKNIPKYLDFLLHLEVLFLGNELKTKGTLLFMHSEYLIFIFIINIIIKINKLCSYISKYSKNMFIQLLPKRMERLYQLSKNGHSSFEKKKTIITVLFIGAMKRR